LRASPTACTVETDAPTVKAKAMSAAPSRLIQDSDIKANPRFVRHYNIAAQNLHARTASLEIAIRDCAS
jgi:hypothetical protein